MSVLINVTARDGEQLEVMAEEGETLMQGLVDHGSEIEAVCGGVMSCATCHIHIEEKWQSVVPRKTDDEAELLDTLLSYDSASRISCQIVVSREMNGLECTIAQSAD